MTDADSPLAITRAESPLAETSATALTRADEAARYYANRSRADSTWRAYEADWRQFALWCAEVELCALPASPGTVARFLAIQAAPTEQRPAGLAPATLKRRLAAIRLMHLGAKHPSPTDAPEVTEVLRGIVNARRDVPIGRKQPVLDTDVCRMVDALSTASLQELRDRAVLLLGFAGALRRSELVALDTHHLERQKAGLLVLIASSKGDQAGAGQTIAIPAQGTSRYCPVKAVEAWQVAANIHTGALFRRFYRGDTPSPHRLSAQSVANIVKQGAAVIGQQAERLGAHSLRRGFLTQAARNQADIFKMAAQSRHRDIRTVMSYVQNEAKFENHPGAHMLKTHASSE